MGCVHGKLCSCSSCHWTHCYCCCCTCRPDPLSSIRHESSSAVRTPPSGGGGGGAAASAPVIRKFQSPKHPISFSGTVAVPSSGLLLDYAAATQRGHYPDSPNRENQDFFAVHTNIGNYPNFHFFAVFDGHGQHGAQCAQFARDHLVQTLDSSPNLLENPTEALISGFHATNTALRISPVDDSMSGTTAIAVLLAGDTLFIANVGDSRAVAGVRKGGNLIAENLSCDHTPFRKDERERVKKAGARVLSVEQLEGTKDPDLQSFGNEESNEGDPPRLWLQNITYPGTAFTRSIGDSMAESIGVIAEPEVLVVKILPELQFFILASDGVFEFLSSQAVVDAVAKYMDPQEACAALTAESCRLWLEHESRIDDVTIIIVHIKDSRNSGDEAIEEISGASSKNSSNSLQNSGSESASQWKRGNLLKMMSSPIPLSMDRSSSSIAPSPTNSIP